MEAYCLEEGLGLALKDYRTDQPKAYEQSQEHTHWEVEVMEVAGKWRRAVVVGGVST